METEVNRGKMQWQPPRGIRFFERAGRPNPFYLQWRVDGRAKTLAFPTEAGREKHARGLSEAMRGDRKDQLREMLEVDPLHWKEWQRFLAGADGVSPLQILAEWKAWRKPVITSDTVSEGVRKFKALKEAANSWGAEMKRHRHRQLDRYAAIFGGRELHTISETEARAWLSMLPVAAHARNDHRKAVHEMYQRGIERGWAGKVSPFAQIDPETVLDDDPTVIPVELAQRFFEANKGEPFIARVALEAFAGVRYKTAGLIGKDGIDFDRLGIRMKKQIHKTGQVDGKSRYRQGHPDNLWKWLRRATDATWSMTLLQYREAKRKGWERAGIDSEQLGVRNIWRHSFISYHLALYNDPPLTQRLAQHTSPEQTEEYEGLATRENAKVYFGIAP